jgi:AcrR family transcriptional regulator
MSPRGYRLGRRQIAVDATRRRILRAAEALLAGRAVPFTIDGVAQRARVTRATVYGHFRSRAVLLEALFDDLAARGGMGNLAGALREAEPGDALAGFIETFGRFWTVYRPIHRRLAALGALDAALDRTLKARQEWRRPALRVLVGRFRDRYGPPPTGETEAVNVLFALTSFQMFDLLAGPEPPASVAPVVSVLARSVLGLAASRPA